MDQLSMKVLLKKKILFWCIFVAVAETVFYQVLCLLLLVGTSLRLFRVCGLGCLANQALRGMERRLLEQ